MEQAIGTGKGPLPMNLDALSNVFGPELAQDVVNYLKTLQMQRESLGWNERQVLSACEEGYPPDTTTDAFKKADHLNDMGWDAHRNKEYQQALDTYRRALDLCPDFPMLWNNKGLAHYRLGQFEEAAQAYHKALQSNPLFIKPYSNLGILYFELQGDREQAMIWFQRALVLDPNYQRARQYLDRMGEKNPDAVAPGMDTEFAEGLIRAFSKGGSTVE